MGLLIDRSNSKLEKNNLINEHALNREPVLLSPPSLISPPPLFQGKKVSKAPSLLSPLPLPLIILHFTVLINHDCKTSCGLIQDVLITNWHLLLILGCMTSNFSYLWFSTLYTSSFGRTEIVVFAKQNKTTASNMSPGLFSPAPLPPPPPQMSLK